MKKFLSSIVVLALLTTASGCAGDVTPREGTEVTALAPAPTVTPPTAANKADLLSGWTLEQKVGQLFVVGVPVSGDYSASYNAVKKYHVGNIFLGGRTRSGVKSVRKRVNKFTGLVSKKATRNTKMFVATDQEGGLVQVLKGPGFSTIPSAMTQATWSRSKLAAKSQTWGKELSLAGVNLNLAPVMDVVPSAASAKKNAPIGYFKRNYGYGTTSTYRKATAFSLGMERAGVDVAIKHFPGLGRVRANTDTSANVVDKVTRGTRADPQIRSFIKGINAGAPFVMMSSAVYSKIDKKNPAAFSKTIISGLLRKQLGFTGVVISDDLSAARAVTKWKPGTRAVKFIQAGGDLILVSAKPGDVKPMVAAVIAKAEKSPAFAKKIDAAVLRVLAVKRN